ncbi:MAG: putative PEP-binding protein, partial [Ruthenibacterium sp.]
VRTMVDGETGLVVQSPDTPTMSQLVQKRLHSIQDERRLGMLRGVPAQTADGVTILLTANIALPADAKMALSCDAEGIGLFRSELLY